MFTPLLRGALAGAAATTALDAVTYVDMAVRGRPSSQTPQQTVEKFADIAQVDIPGDEDTRQNRVDGIGPLLGIATGVAVGTVAGLLRPVLVRTNPLVAAVLIGAAAMAASDLPMRALGITDPAEWSPQDWLADALPHLAFGAIVETALRSSTRP
jgi:hypothetical protein